MVLPIRPRSMTIEELFHSAPETPAVTKPGASDTQTKSADPLAEYLFPLRAEMDRLAAANQDLLASLGGSVRAKAPAAPVLDKEQLQARYEKELDERSEELRSMYAEAQAVREQNAEMGAELGRIRAVLTQVRPAPVAEPETPGRHSEEDIHRLAEELERTSRDLEASRLQLEKSRADVAARQVKLEKQRGELLEDQAAVKADLAHLEVHLSQERVTVRRARKLLDGLFHDIELEIKRISNDGDRIESIVEGLRDEAIANQEAKKAPAKASKSGFLLGGRLFGRTTP